jgi:hypothetical protein
MVKNTSNIQNLIDSVVYYNEKYKLAICQSCGIVFPKNIAAHLRNFHNVLSISERAAILNHINALDIQEPEHIMQNISVKTETDAIDGLSIYELVQCIICQALGAKSTIIRHCQDKHGWTTSQGILIVFFANNCFNVDKANSTDASTKSKSNKIFSSSNVKSKFIYQG